MCYLGRRRDCGLSVETDFHRNRAVIGTGTGPFLNIAEGAVTGNSDLFALSIGILQLERRLPVGIQPVFLAENVILGLIADNAPPGERERRGHTCHVVFANPLSDKKKYC